ncbi:cyclase family protein [Picrophilus oshimae]|uniref:Kynurenine formamidase n=1 Tax=Picrophilus torridus (strain ATCC 700027 / DSM 9790 / JCM 10055 / NBRC 100828 / KAW 2/3) TaxID=1122961 RepID=A0A8G2FXT6_PICTO|nr:cyclase family protein [Picrophilus oshimae]SMD31504.1 Kynurenine formamidase [Picrophilus oshimae DSM 9789]
MEIKDIIDLTNSIYNEMPVWPSSPLPEIKRSGIIPREDYNIEEIKTMTHTSTHIDAPYHFSESGETVDNLNLRSIVGDGFCIEIDKKPGEEITAQDLRSKWREYYNNIILIRTGFSKIRSFDRNFLYNFPGLSMDAADFFMDKNVKTIGIDTLGIEPYWHSDFPVHKKLLSRGFIFIEDMNLENLIEGKRYFIVALPIKIKNGSGAMARCIALDIY